MVMGFEWSGCGGKAQLDSPLPPSQRGKREATWEQSPKGKCKMYMGTKPSWGSKTCRQQGLSAASRHCEARSSLEMKY